MKKNAWIALLFSLALVLALTACGGAPAPAADTATTAPTAAPETQITAAPTAEPTPEPTPEPTEEPKEEPSGEAVMGYLTEDNAYVNEFFGIGCRLDGEWTFFNRDQLLEANGVVADIVTDEEISRQLAEAMEEGKTFYTMYAATEGGETTSMMVQKLTAAEALFAEEKASLQASMEFAMQQLESMGMTDVTGELVTVTMAGREMPCLRVRAQFYGVTVCSETLAVKKSAYMAMLNLTCFSEESVEDLYNAWYAMD